MPLSQIKFLSYVTELVPKYIRSVYVTKGVAFINIYKEYVVQFGMVLKRHELSRFESLLDIWAVDRPSYLYRFKVGYNILSVFYNLRLVVYISTLKDSVILSLSSLFRSSVWLEREVWDMFGIFFSNHVDLRRILTDYGFSGFPLRKDFPLSGYFQARYDEEDKKVVLESLSLEQEFRFFNFSSPWARLE